MKEKYAKPNPSDIKEKLTPLQYEVTQNNGTEKPFSSDLNSNYEEGIYVDIVSEEPLFSSKDKFDAGCGWPSFTKPIESKHIIEQKDTSHGMIRTELNFQPIQALNKSSIPSSISSSVIFA